ncbi:MAG: outer membrane beta-barrel protein [Acidobacteriota bacterium]|nr:outer membrane beta-barrel protein [Acidobacteriota bacterium]
MVALAIMLTILQDTGGAQDRGRLAVNTGYSFLSNTDVTDGYGLGWVAEGSWRLSSRFHVVLEVSRHTRSQDVGFIDVSTSDESATAGVRYRWGMPHISPFAHALAGASRLDVQANTRHAVRSTGSDAATWGTLQIGGGIETDLSRRIRLRIGADYRRVFTDTRRNQIRATTGVTYQLW